MSNERISTCQVDFRQSVTHWKERYQVVPLVLRETDALMKIYAQQARQAMTDGSLILSGTDERDMHYMERAHPDLLLQEKPEESMEEPDTLPFVKPAA